MTAATNFRTVPKVGFGTTNAIDYNGLAAIPAVVPSRAHADWDLLQGACICHFSSIQRSMDSRSFYLEAVPVAAMGLRPKFIAPHRMNGLREGVDLVSIRRPRRPAVRILLAPRILRRLLRIQADIYQLHDPELLPVGLLLKSVFRKRVVYDSCEDFPLMMLTKPWIPCAFRSFLAKIVSCFEWLAARWLDGILTADSATLRRFAKVGRSKKRVFYNFPRLDLFPEPQFVSKKFDIVYRGGLSERAGTFVLLDAVRRLAEEGQPVRLLLIGYIDNDRAERLIRERIRALEPGVVVELRGRIEHSAMAEALAEARIGVCPLQAIPKFLHNIPVKVWEYWACGLPVIASDLPPIRPFFQDGEFGILYKPDDPNELAAAIRRLLEHPEEAERMGGHGRRAVVERFNNECQVRGLISFYSRILS
jgi:glycosyltransferase involved in cell wall biosynthesis